MELPDMVEIKLREPRSYRVAENRSGKRRPNDVRDHCEGKRIWRDGFSLHARSIPDWFHSMADCVSQGR
jgi:hypothetical protein